MGEPNDELARLRAENARLRIALADAVCRPMGVIPASADSLLPYADYEAATRRRPPLSGCGAPSMRPIPFVAEVIEEDKNDRR